MLESNPQPPRYLFQHFDQLGKIHFIRRRDRNGDETLITDRAPKIDFHSESWTNYWFFFNLILRPFDSNNRSDNDDNNNCYVSNNNDGNKENNNGDNNDSDSSEQQWRKKSEQI